MDVLQIELYNQRLMFYMTVTVQLLQRHQGFSIITLWSTLPLSVV